MAYGGGEKYSFTLVLEKVREKGELQGLGQRESEEIQEQIFEFSSNP
ncbi:hypothetical protein L195_g043262, partial [Trifolium pratense]